jgi:SAM-dependent methyltransferase
VLNSRDATPPPVILLQMMTSYWASQAIFVAAKLGIADLLAAGPVSTEELARATASHAPSLYRLLRALASVGVFTETTAHYFGLTPLAALLQTTTPGSMHSLAILYSDPCYRAWEDLLHSVRTGENAFEHGFGMPIFDYFAQHPETDRVFNDAMVGYSHQVANDVVRAYDFSPFGVVVDVGGGYGTLLTAILRGTPDARGILFDQPHVVNGAERYLIEGGVSGRCGRIGGDFFAAVPAGGDVYLLSQILHDWDDERSVAILQQCRRAMAPQCKLLVVELVIPTGNEPFFGKWLDLHMLTMATGRERTSAEYDMLFRAAGFELSRVIPTTAGPSVVEAIPV